MVVELVEPMLIISANNNIEITESESWREGEAGISGKQAP